MKLIVTPQAAQELREVEEYIGKDNPKAAIEFVGRLTDRFSELVRFPGMGRKRDESDQDTEASPRATTSSFTGCSAIMRYRSCV